jgi:hypothetical protein
MVIPLALSSWASRDCERSVMICRDARIERPDFLEEHILQP